MSRFFSEKYNNLEAYTPGEQPKDMQYTKLNTNESPFPPSDKARTYAAEAAKRLQLYCDPECTELTKTFAKLYGIGTDEVLFTNGSDDALNFAFMAFCDESHPAAFPDITYGFYPVFAELNHVPYEEIPLNEDFTINVDDYCGINKTIFIANPNAPTGIALSLEDIKKILESNPDNVVVIDEAYIGFGPGSAIKLINEYDNLLVTQTFSKSWSLAGGRLGMAIGNRELIRDLNTLKYSTNPYNVNTMTQAAGTASLLCRDEFEKNRRTITAVLLIRLILLPVAMVAFAYLIGLRGVELFLILMIFGTPVATSSYPMAQNMGGDGQLAGQLVFVSTVASLVTIFLFIFTLSRLGLLV